MSVDPQVEAFLAAIAQMGTPPMSQLGPEAAREMYRAMGAMEVPEEIQRVDDRHVPADSGEVPIRVYTPQESVGSDHGVLVWFHGGGWVIGDIETADATCRGLANRSGCVVVSVDYRLSPEHKAPAALDDCLAAITWTVENAELLGVDASRVAVGGDSAGGNLAALACQRVRDEFGPDIDFQLLVYPVTDLTLGHPSIDENAEGKLLTKDTMEWFVECYLAADQDPKDPSVSPLHAESLAGLPPALVITAELDPLRDEGEAYAARLIDAGVTTDLRRFDGQIHGFFAMPSVFDSARQAVQLAGEALRAALT